VSIQRYISKKSLTKNTVAAEHFITWARKKKRKKQFKKTIQGSPKELIHH
jgi:hypothetical protein